MYIFIYSYIWIWLCINAGYIKSIIKNKVLSTHFIPYTDRSKQFYGLNISKIHTHDYKYFILDTLKIIKSFYETALHPKPRVSVSALSFARSVSQDFRWKPSTAAEWVPRKLNFYVLFKEYCFLFPGCSTLEN